MKRLGHDPRPAVIERRYNDFCFIYECILKSFHPSILGEFLFPKKVLIGNFKAEVISESMYIEYLSTPIYLQNCYLDTYLTNNYELSYVLA